MIGTVWVVFEDFTDYDCHHEMRSIHATWDSALAALPGGVAVADPAAGPGEPVGMWYAPDFDHRKGVGWMIEAWEVT